MADRGAVSAGPEIAWFGGYEGAIDIDTKLLHLLRDDGILFCGWSGITARATTKNLGNVMWCAACVQECQEVRRDA